MSDRVPAELVFDDPAPKEIPTKIGGNSYYLVEASATAAAAYKNAKYKAFRMNDGKVSGIDLLADADLVLLRHCLVRAKADGSIDKSSNGKYVTVRPDEIDGLAYRVQKALVKAVKDVSGITEEEADETAKKGGESGPVPKASSTGTPPSSD